MRDAGVRARISRGMTSNKLVWTKQMRRENQHLSSSHMKVYIVLYTFTALEYNLQGEKWAKQYKQKQVKALLH